jgi:NTE family protein
LCDRPELRSCDLVAYDVSPGSGRLDGWAAVLDPVQAMADLGEGPIIAVDVKATFERAADGRPLAEGREHRERAPSLGETLARVLLLGSANTSDAARRHADLIIRPRAEGVGLLEFHQLDVAREAGRAAGRETLEAAPTALFL